MRRLIRSFPTLPIGSLILASLLLVGCTGVPMRSQQVWRSLIDYDYPADEVGTPAFEAALDKTTESRAVPGNSVLLVENGDETYPEMLNLIRSAATRISFETYIIENDGTTDAFFTALKEAAARGVEVRFLVDAAGYRRGILARVDELSDHGIQARVFNPYFLSWTLLRGNNRDHRKILVVDGAHAVLGGINLSDDQLGDGVSGWRDTSLLVSGPAAHEAEKVFAETWEQAGRGFFGKSVPIAVLNPVKREVEEPILQFLDKHEKQPRFAPPPYAGGAEAIRPVGNYHGENVPVRVVASSPDSFNSPTYDLAIQTIQGARERLDIASAYFVPHLSVRRALVRAAERGVRVRLLLPGVTDVRFVREIGMKFYGELLAAGVEIYEWPHVILHSKTMAVDGKLTVVGSANMDGRSFFLNYEANLVAEDAALAEEAHRRFEEDIRRSRRLTLAEWRQRGAGQRLLEIVMTPAAGQF